MDSRTSGGKTSTGRDFQERGDLIRGRQSGGGGGSRLYQPDHNGREEVEEEVVDNGVQFRNPTRRRQQPANAVADVEVERMEWMKMDADLTTPQSPPPPPHPSSSSIDGRCGCCPYGYHIDLDFLRYMNAQNNGQLSQADQKKMQRHKRKLRRSMEFFLHQQELGRKKASPSSLAEGGQSPAPGESSQSATQSSSSTSGLDGGKSIDAEDDVQLMTRTRTGTNEDAAAAEALLGEFDKAFNAQLRLMDQHPGASRHQQLQTTTRASKGSHEGRDGEEEGDGEDNENRFRTETDFKLSGHHHHLAAPNSPATGHHHHHPHHHHLLMDYDDSCSSLSASSGPSTPSSQFSPAPQRSKLGKTVVAEALEAKQPSSSSSSTGFVGSIQLAANMAALLLDRVTSPTTKDEDYDNIETIHHHLPSCKDVLSKDMSKDILSKDILSKDILSKDLSEDVLSKDILSKDLSKDILSKEHFEDVLSKDLSKDMMTTTMVEDVTQISSGTLQAIRKQMAVSLERMRELEEQVKAIPVLQVRVSILKEEKRQLKEQLNERLSRNASEANESTCMSHIQQQDFSTPTLQRRRMIPGGELFSADPLPDSPKPLSPRDRFPGFFGGSTPPCPRKPLRSVGVGDGNVFASTATTGVTAPWVGNGFDGAPHHAGLRLTERELNTNEHTELRERETKTLFLGGDTSSLSPESFFPVSNRRTGRHERPKVPPKPKSTRTAKVGTDAEFPPSPTNYEVHERELRTVYIEDSPRQTRSTRNVGIQCRAAMRDVGVMHLSENERPMQRTIGVGVGEIGVGEGGSGPTTTTSTAISGLMSAVRNTAVGTSRSSSHLFTSSSAETRRIHIRDDQLRTVLDEMLRKTVHSVAVQCRPSTVDQGAETVGAAAAEAAVDVGCGDDDCTVDVDVVPRRQMRSVAVDNRPSISHRSSATDDLRRRTVDTATNTRTSRQTTADSETNTDLAHTNTTVTSSATNTEAPDTRSVSTTTADQSLILICDSETNTEPTPRTSSIATSTLIIGDVEQLVQKPPSTSVSTNTVSSSSSSSLSCHDVAVNTVVCESLDKSVATLEVLCEDISSNTDRMVTLVSASTNTEKLCCVSRSVGDLRSIFGDQETEPSSGRVNGGHGDGGVLLQEVDIGLQDAAAADADAAAAADADAADDVDGVFPRVAADCASMTSRSYEAPGRELSQGRGDAEVEAPKIDDDNDDDSCSSSEAIIPDLQQLHDQTVRLTVSANQSESSTAIMVDLSDHNALLLPLQSLSSNKVVEMRAAEKFGARPRDFSFSFPESSDDITTTKTMASQTMAPVPYNTSPVVSPMRTDYSRMLSGETEAEAAALSSPSSEQWMLSASDDSVSTQCSVIERSTLDRSWTAWKPGEKENDSMLPVGGREADEGRETVDESLFQRKRKTDRGEMDESVVVSEIYRGRRQKKRTSWEFSFGDEQKKRGHADDDDDADEEYGEEDRPSSELDFLMDCLEMTAISGGGDRDGDSTPDAETDDVVPLCNNEIPAVSDGVVAREGGTLPPSEPAAVKAVAAVGSFRPRCRDVAASSPVDSFILDEDDDRCTSGEWPSGTSVFDSEAPDKGLPPLPNDLTQSSVLDNNEDVEFPIALELRGQGRRVIMTETRTERQRRRTGEIEEGGGGGEGVGEENGDGHGGQGGAASTSVSGTLKSIIKSTSSTEGGRSRKEISFSEYGVVNNYVPASAEDMKSESDEEEGSRSSLSFDEGTYECSQLPAAAVTRGLYSCAAAATAAADDEELRQDIWDDDDGRDDDERDDDDDRDDAVFDLDDFTFSDHNLRDIYELSEEMVEACTTYTRWLEGEEQLSVEQLNINLAIMQSEWFFSTSQKLADPSQVEDHLTQINEISRKLLEYIVNMVDSNGNTALHYAISHCNMEVVNMILDTGVCDVDKRNRAGYNAIMLASLADVQTQRQRDVIRRLFDMGDVNQTALQAGQTALMLAVSHGDVNVARMLLEAGSKVNVQDEDGSTALMCASEHGHVDIVKLLLAQDECDASLVDNDGSTAISIAMEAGHREVGILLYAHLNFKPGSPMAGQRKMKKKTNESSSLAKN